MGYMGLDHWQESDLAADFVFVVQKTTTAKELSDVIDKELMEQANEYNTPGCVNIALAIEDNIINKNQLSQDQLLTLKNLLMLLDLDSSRDDLKNDPNEQRHNAAYRRLLQVVS